MFQKSYTKKRYAKKRRLRERPSEESEDMAKQLIKSAAFC